MAADLLGGKRKGEGERGVVVQIYFDQILGQAGYPAYLARHVGYPASGKKYFSQNIHPNARFRRFNPPPLKAPEQLFNPFTRWKSVPAYNLHVSATDFDKFNKELS